MKKIVFLFLFLFTTNCGNKLEFPIKNLKNIFVYRRYFTKENGLTVMDTKKICVINNIDSINYILSALNSNQKEFVIFMPSYEIELNYKDTIITLGINRNLMVIKGLQYKINKNLDEYFLHIKDPQ